MYTITLNKSHVKRLLKGNGRIKLAYDLTADPYGIEPYSGSVYTNFTVNWTDGTERYTVFWKGDDNPPSWEAAPGFLASPFTFNCVDKLDRETNTTNVTPGYYTLFCMKIDGSYFTIPFEITSFGWKSNYAFPVCGIAISGGEASLLIYDDSLYLSKNSLTEAYEIYLGSQWDNSNLVRIPLVWGYKSSGNDYNMMFTSSNFPGENGSWEYDIKYLEIVVPIVQKCVLENKVVIIDMHTYNLWNSEHIINENTSDQRKRLALIWGNILKVFDNYEVFQNKFVWFELLNEPFVVSDFSMYQETIDQIRNIGVAPYPSLNKSYTNKIILELDVNSGFNHIVSNPNYEPELSAYTGVFPTDSANNLCIAVHQYFNTNGSGDYKTYPMMDWNPPNLVTILDNISKLKNSSFDYILGEFGYDKEYDPEKGAAAVTLLLNSMMECNSNNNKTPSTVTDILNKTSGGLWLGFAAWQLDSGGESLGWTNYATNDMYDTVYSNYIPE
jgi:hypothetical protein